MLFNTAQCGNWYRAAMSIKRFEFLIRCLRFDDKETRDKRRDASKLAPVSDMWNIFLENCRKHYKPGSYLTIDEQLVPFRGRCPFRMFMPKKPAKYGIKINMMVDCSTKYMIDALPYTGKATLPGNNSAESVVDSLVSSVKNTHRNITFDNWFTSIPLVIKLKDYGLTAVGTLKKIKKNYPQNLPTIHTVREKLGHLFFCTTKT